MTKPIAVVPFSALPSVCIVNGVPSKVLGLALLQSGFNAKSALSPIHDPKSSAVDTYKGSNYLKVTG